MGHVYNKHDTERGFIEIEISINYVLHFFGLTDDFEVVDVKEREPINYADRVFRVLIASNRIPKGQGVQRAQIACITTYDGELERISLVTHNLSRHIVDVIDRRELLKSIVPYAKRNKHSRVIRLPGLLERMQQ
jgi:hypothetical protein